MTKVLKLYNTFKKSFNNVEISGKLISVSNNAGQPINGSFYICGPTVYSESHVGHALTYIRADLFRRFMKSTFNVNLFTVMNITDIDDKILEKTKEQYSELEKFPTDPTLHPFNRISERYRKSFLDDMSSIKIIPADLYMNVTRQVDLITSFIQNLETNGYAYKTQDGDIRFRTGSVKNYVTRIDPRRKDVDPTTDKNLDFVLWKAAKPDEPQWIYQSSLDGSILPGRPGWHVQCSAISSAIFGNQLDFHFGGKDLIFPHHYNEEACSCAYHLLDTSRSIHVWANHWLHSGHLVLEDRKMSKSLGNVMPIKNFLDRSSLNALRLMCLKTHYRSDIEFSENLLADLKSLDHKISAFVAYLREQLERVQESPAQLSSSDPSHDNDLLMTIVKTRDEILDGLCDDFDTKRGLDSLLSISKEIYSKNKDDLRPRDLLDIWCLLKDWCTTCGLDYGGLTSSKIDTRNESLSKVLFDFRSKVRTLALNDLRYGNSANNPENNLSKLLLKECDNVRAQADELGFVLRDSKS